VLTAVFAAQAPPFLLPEGRPDTVPGRVVAAAAVVPGPARHRRGRLRAESDTSPSLVAAAGRESFRPPVPQHIAHLSERVEALRTGPGRVRPPAPCGSEPVTISSARFSSCVTGHRRLPGGRRLRLGWRCALRGGGEVALLAVRCCLVCGCRTHIPAMAGQESTPGVESVPRLARTSTAMSSAIITCSLVTAAGCRRRGGVR
jgi:hypothetical protein